AVYDAAAPDAAPRRIELPGREPRALAVDGRGARVFVTFFQGGNRTTVVPSDRVRASGDTLAPAAADPAHPAAPQVARIVRRVNGAWVDERGRRWDLPYG